MAMVGVMTVQHNALMDELDEVLQTPAQPSMLTECEYYPLHESVCAVIEREYEYLK